MAHELVGDAVTSSPTIACRSGRSWSTPPPPPSCGRWRDALLMDLLAEELR
jgi:hypothetical protein